MEYGNMTPEDLYKLWLAGDEQAFEELYARFFPKLRSFIKRYFEKFSEDDITDIIQDIFIKLFGSEFDPTKAQLFSWLCTICWSICLDRCRKRNYSHPELSLSDEDILIFINTQQVIKTIQQATSFSLYKFNAEEIILKKEVIEMVQAAIPEAKLTPEEKVAVDLFLLEHKKPTYAEIRDTLQELTSTNKEYCENTLRNRWATAIKKIYNVLKNNHLFIDLLEQYKENLIRKERRESKKNQDTTNPTSNTSTNQVTASEDLANTNPKL